MDFLVNKSYETLCPVGRIPTNRALKPRVADKRREITEGEYNTRDTIDRLSPLSPSQGWELGMGEGKTRLFDRGILVNVASFFVSQLNTYILHSNKRIVCKKHSERQFLQLTPVVLFVFVFMPFEKSIGRVEHLREM